MKKLMITTLFVLFAMCLTCVSALAYEPWVENGAICIKPVTLADGSELTQINAGETINLKTTVKAGKDAAVGQTVQLVVTAYKNGLINGLSGIGLSEKITVTDTPQPLTASFTVPAGTDNLKVFVLDDRAVRRPIAQAGVVNSDASLSVDNILVDGAQIDGFAKDVYEYNVTLPAAYIGVPELVVNTNDILAKTEITRSTELPASSWSESIAVTKGGENAAYTVNFTQTAPAITNALHYQFNSGRTDIETMDVNGVDGFNLVTLKEPTYDGYDKSLLAAGGVSIAPADTEYVATDITNTKYMIYDIPEEFLGGTYFQLKNVRGTTSTRILSTNALKQNGVTSDITTPVPVEDYKSYSFDINRSATIYAYLPDDGSSDMNLSVFESEGFTNDDTLYLKYYNYKDSALTTVTYGTNWYKKHVDVSVEDGTKTVNIPVGTFPIRVIVKFD